MRQTNRERPPNPNKQPDLLGQTITFESSYNHIYIIYIIISRIPFPNRSITDKESKFYSKGYGTLDLKWPVRFRTQYIRNKSYDLASKGIASSVYENNQSSNKTFFVSGLRPASSMWVIVWTQRFGDNWNKGRQALGFMFNWKNNN